jgi:hypothetical protein
MKKESFIIFIFLVYLVNDITKIISRNPYAIKKHLRNGTPISSNNFILCVMIVHFIDDRIKQHMTKLVLFSTIDLIKQIII